MNAFINKFFLGISKKRVLTFLIFIFFIKSILAQSPTISNVNLLNGKNGVTVSITGKNFSTASQVYFGQIAASTTLISTTQLNAVVPIGASYDRISVTNNNIGSVQSDVFFTVKTASPCKFTDPIYDTAVVFPTNTNPSNISLANLDGKGLSELLILGANSTLTTYLNVSKPGNLDFTSAATYPLLPSRLPSSMIVCDLNNDKVFDVVVGYSTGSQISILEGKPGGTFTDAVHITVGKSPKNVAVGDFDEDGFLEIVAANNVDKSLVILKNKNTTLFNFSNYAIVKSLSSTSVTSIDIGDFNNDSNKDIIVTDGDKGYYYPNLTKFNFDKPIELYSPSADIIKIGDYNLDIKTDAIFGTKAGIVGSAFMQSVYKTTMYPDLNFTSSLIDFTGIDFNNDGNPDIAALFPDEKGFNNISFYQNDGSGKFESIKSSIFTGINTNSNLISGDVDGDGQSDLITYNSKGEMYIYRKSSEIYITNPQGTTVCVNTQATVSAETNAGTISWYDSKNNVLGQTGSTLTLPGTQITGTSIIVKAASSNGTCSSTSFTPITIYINQLPTLTASGTFSTPVCPNGTVKVNMSGATTYIWSSADVTGTAGAYTILPKNVTPLNNTTNHTLDYSYTVTGTDVTTGCKNTLPVTARVYNNLAAIATNATNNTICSGQNVAFTISSTSPFDIPGYTWSTSPSGYQPNATTNIANPINPSNIQIPIIYTVSGLINGCQVTANTTIKVNPIPIITPSSLQTIKVGQTYKQDFTVLNGTNTTYTILPVAPSTALPTGFTFTGNTLQSNGAITTAGTYYFSITAKEPLKCDAVTNYKLIIEDLIDPRLIVFPIYVHAGDPDFLIRPSSTLSDGSISYTIKTGFTSSCAKIGSLGFVSSISCADSIPVIVTQVAKDGFRQSVVETYIKISPNPDTKLKLTTTGVLLSNDTTQLKYFTNSDAARAGIQIVQLNNTDIAQINTDGTITTYKQGTVDIEIRVPATSTYEAITRSFTVAIYPAIQKPIIVNDTIIITVDQDTIVNILTNDYGVTNAVAPSQTDIDLENTGVQNKFYSLTIGNFLIDLNGNLNVKPFSGFIGEGRIGYTVTDSLGITSDVGYIFINVIPLTITPPLKANEVMTPNNDGLNDGLVIAYAYLDDNNSLIIMDEIGNVVYETTNYQNDWRGVNKKGDAIEPGTYFYVYKEKGSGRELKNYIQIVK
ncbi:FG-GAP-like repeat-containing protein [Cytophaga aurantiaca]|uniref:FG-GAP-like repeat-containing protein n=1 Tax=Cytophaga aurantiaca TaxID=29530 RepID=UPI0003702CE9|nr:FG-GAP-like repeat-containing protein [Cytophaga aurantiaca]